MGVWESPGKSDEWYTPAYIFDALGAVFDLDVAAPDRTSAPWFVDAARRSDASLFLSPKVKFAVLWRNRHKPSAGSDPTFPKGGVR